MQSLVFTPNFTNYTCFTNSHPVGDIADKFSPSETTEELVFLHCCISEDDDLAFVRQERFDLVRWNGMYTAE